MRPLSQRPSRGHVFRGEKSQKEKVVAIPQTSIVSIFDLYTVGVCLQDTFSLAVWHFEETADISVPFRRIALSIYFSPVYVSAVPVLALDSSHFDSCTCLFIRQLKTRSSTFSLSFSYINLHNGSLERPLSLGCPERLRWCFLHGCMFANLNSFPSCPHSCLHADVHIF